MSEYRPPDKAIKDMTPEELEAFKQYFVDQLSPEERESWAKIGQAFTELSQSPEVQAFKEGIAAVREAAQAATPYIEILRDMLTTGREFLPLFIEELKAAGIEDEETPIEDIGEWLDRPEVKQAIDRATARMGEPIEESPQEILEQATLLSNRFLPMLNGEPTNAIMSMTKKTMKADHFKVKATYEKNGQIITVDSFNELQGALSVPAKKLLHTGVLYLTDTNYYRNKNAATIIPTAQIPLTEYLKANGYPVEPQPGKDEKAEAKRINNLMKTLTRQIRQDLHDLKTITWTGKGTGRNRGDYAEMSLLSSFRVSIKSDTIRVNFDVDMAKYLVNAYQMQFPVVLLLHDNRNPNSYPIGYKLALHNSMDTNFARGTDSTLSVQTLLKEAPEIPTIEELKEKGRRDWKAQIKKKLEKSLDDNINIGLISKWEYRHPKTGKVFTEKTAQRLSWDEYILLMVDFIMVAPPDQSERRAAKEADRQAKQ